MESIGVILKKYMDPTVPQASHSKKLDVTPQYVNNILNDKKKPSKKFLEKFYNIFGVSSEDKEKIRDILVSNKLPTGYSSIVSDYREIKSQFEDVVSIPVIGEIFGDIYNSEITIFNSDLNQKSLLNSEYQNNIYIHKFMDDMENSFVIKTEYEIYIFKTVNRENINSFFYKRKRNVVLFNENGIFKVKNVEYVSDKNVYLFFDINGDGSTAVISENELNISVDLSKNYIKNLSILGILIGNIYVVL